MSNPPMRASVQVYGIVWETIDYDGKVLSKQEQSKLPKTQTCEVDLWDDNNNEDQTIGEWAAGIVSDYFGVDVKICKTKVLGKYRA